MTELENARVVVTGGTSGLGLGLVEALSAKRARVTVVGRNAERLADVEKRYGVRGRVGDATDPTFAHEVLREAQASIVVLNAGASPRMVPIHSHTWETFSEVWNNDVKIGFHWIQEALRLPLAPGSRVLVTSSGAAIAGSLLSGGYAGAKRMLWLMAGYANAAASDLGVGVRFQTILPMQLVPETNIGMEAGRAYAERKGVSYEQFMSGFGAQLTPRIFGDRVVAILSDAQYENAATFGIKASGIQLLDTASA